MNCRELHVPFGPLPRAHSEFAGRQLNMSTGILADGGWLSRCRHNQNLKRLRIPYWNLLMLTLQNGHPGGYEETRDGEWCSGARDLGKMFCPGARMKSGSYSRFLREKSSHCSPKWRFQLSRSWCSGRYILHPSFSAWQTSIILSFSAIKLLRGGPDDGRAIRRKATR